MHTSQELSSILRRIDGKGYKAYKDLQGDYDLGPCLVHIDHVQSDPFAPPSRIRATIKQNQAKIPEEFFSTPVRRIAAEDYLTRNLARVAAKVNKPGAGKGGQIQIDRPGQEILPRSSMRLSAQEVQARFVLGLPAKGRTIMGRQAEDILLQTVPHVVDKALCMANIDISAMRRHIQVCEDQEALRRALDERGLVAFVGNGAILPRQSGISDRPLSSKEVVPFTSPADMEVTFDLPNQGQVKGMGLQKGVNLIVGGGYHGKSTLLKALERSVYDHIPNDGRELVVTEASAVKIRAEDGRSVAGVNIEPFISHLPMGQDTSYFSSDNASGSTSQAANIVEAVEAGSSLLLVDEDTSATNFMIRDSRMQQLVASEFEPITPFIDRVQELSSRMGVSTILVLGGSGDYLDVADTVIMLKNYQPQNVTEQARSIASRMQTERSHEVASAMTSVTKRSPRPKCFRLGPRDKVKAKGRTGLVFGREDIDLSLVEQVVDTSQARALAAIFRLFSQDFLQSGMPLQQAVEAVLQSVYAHSLDFLSPNPERPWGDLALPRREDICAAINRFRSLQVVQADNSR